MFSSRGVFDEFLYREAPTTHAPLWNVFSTE